jgi:hypothetical protein
VRLSGGEAKVYVAKFRTFRVSQMLFLFETNIRHRALSV